MKIYIDCETLGLNGGVATIQFSLDRQPVKIIHVWKLWKELDLRVIKQIEWLKDILSDPENKVIGFNLSYDLYHQYRVFHQYYHDEILESVDRPCLPLKSRPVDLYNHAFQKSILAPYAFAQNSELATIRDIPEKLADVVIKAIEDNMAGLIPSVAKVKHTIHKEKKHGDIEMVSITFSLDLSLSLKTLIKVYDENSDILTLSDHWELPNFEEKLYLPYPSGNYTELMKKNLVILNNPNSLFWKYCVNDIHYLWRLEDELGQCDPDDNDYNIAVNAYTRYKGFRINRSYLEGLFETDTLKIKELEFVYSDWNLNSPDQKKKLLQGSGLDVLNTSKETLENTLKLLSQESESFKEEIRILTDLVLHGTLKQKLNQLSHLLESQTHRGHPELNIIGTSTGRAAGAGGLNWQGIGRNSGIRQGILTSWGGDFDAFEISIAQSVYQDKQMDADLRDGIDLHSMSATMFYDTLNYPEFILHKKESPYKDQRYHAKQSNFAILYGGGPVNISQECGTPMEQAEKGYEKFFDRYTGIKEYFEKNEKSFYTVDVKTWSEHCIEKMSDQIEDIFGNKQSFRFEKKICNLFWHLGMKDIVKRSIPELSELKIVRKEMKGEQTWNNCVKSAFLGSVITMQQAILRRAINTPVQMTGAYITKKLIRRLWTEHYSPMLNIHDEIIFPDYAEENFSDTVKNFIEEKKSLIPFLSMAFKKISNWGEK